MAVHAHSTTAPAEHRGLLQAFAEAAPVPTPALTAETVDMLDAIEPERPARVRDASGRFVKLAPELPPELLLATEARCGAAGIPKSGDTPDAIRTDLDALVATCGHMSTGPVPANDTPSSPHGGAPIRPTAGQTCDALVANRRHMPTVRPAECVDINTPSLDAARTLHLRRQLAQAAEHGAALLASLGLPRLVAPDFVRLDIHTAGDALDLAIATLDALDGDVDLEDGADDELSLGWEKPSSQLFLTEGAYSGDRELDTADAEPSLASPERHPAVPAPGYCARYGAYVDRSSAGKQLRWAEGARDDRELVPEDGPIDDDELDGAGEVDAEPSIGWPEDFTAEVEATLEASADAEHDDADLEHDERHGSAVWVFGPSRREVAHV